MESRTTAENTAGGSGISCMGLIARLTHRRFPDRDLRFAHILLNEAPLLHQAGSSSIDWFEDFPTWKPPPSLSSADQP